MEEKEEKEEGDGSPPSDPPPSSTTSPHHPQPPPSFCAQNVSSPDGRGGWGVMGAGRLVEAGRQSVMSCQQCSRGSLTYFQKYH